MQFKVSDHRKMPGALEPTLTSEQLRPSAYYQAIRQQKVALSSLSLVHGKREKDKYLKARSSEQVRKHLADANLQAKLHSNQNKQKPLAVNDYDVINVLRKDRTTRQKQPDQSSQRMGSASFTFIKSASNSQSLDHLGQTQATQASVNNVSGYGNVATWQPRSGTPGDPQIVQFQSSANRFYTNDMQRHQSAKAGGSKPPRFPMSRQGTEARKVSTQLRNRQPPSTANPSEDPRERLARQIQKINEGFWGTLHANTMHKVKYNQLMRSKEAQSFGSLGPQNSISHVNMGGTTKSLLNVSDSESMAFEMQHNLQNVGTQANGSINMLPLNMSLQDLPPQERHRLHHQLMAQRRISEYDQGSYQNSGQLDSQKINQATVMTLRQNNLHWFLIRQMLEKKDFNELKSFKQRLQMQKISDIHTQTKSGKLNEAAIWKEHEEQQRILAQNQISQDKLSPSSVNEFRKQIFGTHGANTLGMRTSGKQSSVVTQHVGRNSQANVSEFSEHKIAASKLSKNKLKDESSLNKSSNEKVGDLNSDDDSDSSDEQSEVFVRTKAANHNTSSIEENEEGHFDTMKHNDKNIIAAGQPGVVGSSQNQSQESNQRSNIEKQGAAGIVDARRRPVKAGSKLGQASGNNKTSSLSNSIEATTQNLIPALNLGDTKNQTLASSSNDNQFDARLLSAQNIAGHAATVPNESYAGSDNADRAKQSLMQNQMLQEYNRKPIVGGAVLDMSMNTHMASQQFLSNAEFNHIAVGSTHKESQPFGAKDSTAAGDQIINMKVDLGFLNSQADSQQGYGFKSSIKSQYDLASERPQASSHASKSMKRAQSTGVGRRQNKKINTFDVQVRSYNYKGVPEPSQIQLAKTAVGTKKAHRDKLIRQKQVAGCSLFKYRNNRAFNFEKDQLQRGVTVREGNYATQAPMLNSTFDSQPIQMTSLDQAADQAIQSTTMSQIQEVLSGGQNEKGKEMLISAMSQLSSEDPNAVRLLDDVLESLKFKNGQAQKVDGQISEFMHPDAKKAQAFVDKEREASRKLNNSAVMPVGEVTDEAPAPEGLIKLFAKHGVRDNKKVPPQEQNVFYQELTKGAAQDTQVAEVNLTESRRATATPKVAKLDLNKGKSSHVETTQSKGHEATTSNNYDATDSGEGEGEGEDTQNVSGVDQTAQSFDKDIAEISKAVQLQFIAGKNADQFTLVQDGSDSK